MRNILIILFLSGMAECFAGTNPIVIGTASVYSENFEGNLTASGEVFLHSNLTAAHRTLPFGTYVRLTRPERGKSVIVKINDRGPYLNNRIVDISGAAAKALGFSKSETEVEIQLEVINPDDLRASMIDFSPQVDTEKSRSTSTVKHEFHPKKTEHNFPSPSVQPIVRKTPVIVTSKSVTREKINYRDVKTPSSYNLNAKKEIRLVNYNTSGGKFGVQVAALQSKANSLGTISALKKQGINDVFLNVNAKSDLAAEYKIIVGEYPSEKLAAERQKVLKKNKINGFVVPLQTQMP